MGKNPADQFYWEDWKRDTRCLSLAAKGAWIDLLSDMWFAPIRGRLSMPIVAYARSLGATVDQTEAVLQELTERNICNYVQESDGSLTLICRRMSREHEERLRWREKKRLQRTSNGVPKLSSQCPAPSSKSSTTSTSSKPSKTKPKPSLSRLPPDEAIGLASLLRKLTVQNGAKPPTEAQENGWAKEAELLLRIDRRPLAEVEEVLRWSQADSFWKANILSMAKFRKQYDQLKLKMAGEHGKREGNTATGAGANQRTDQEIPREAGTASGTDYGAALRSKASLRPVRD